MGELTTGTIRKIYCNTCKTKTNHELKIELDGPHYEEVDRMPYPSCVYWEKTEYRLWSCLGCDTAVLEDAFNSEPMIDEDGNPIWKSSYYPKLASQDLPKQHFRRLDKKLAAIYEEVVDSYNAGLRIVCAMGLRALVEGICVSKGITDEEAWGFEAKLKKLDEKGHLPSNIVECLYSFKFMGDAAAHRLETPTQDELELALKVVEDMLNFLYEIEYRLASSAKALADKRSMEMIEFKKRKRTSDPNVSS